MEVIGQAANKISKNAQDGINNIPWGNIIGLRNKLAHDYGEIPAERIWQIIKKSMPELMDELEKIEELKEYIEKTNWCLIINQLKIFLWRTIIYILLFNG